MIEVKIYTDDSDGESSSVIDMYEKILNHELSTHSPEEYNPLLIPEDYK